MKIILFFLCLMNFVSFADQLTTCNYLYYGYPLFEVSFTSTSEGVADFVTVSMQGQKHKESLTQVKNSPSETFHGWISKNTPNEIEMIIFRELQREGQSKIVNNRMPIGKEMWGSCQIKEI